ncbi:MAG: hypothetical protein AB2693_25170 [Candidatus Thiodiazotropha sp.]
MSLMGSISGSSSGSPLPLGVSGATGSRTAGLYIRFLLPEKYMEVFSKDEIILFFKLTRRIFVIIVGLSQNQFTLYIHLTCSKEKNAMVLPMIMSTNNPTTKKKL